MRIHILGSGNAAKKHRAAMENVGGFEFTSYDDADIIDICTPNFQHVLNIFQAVEARKNIIVEKPVCVSLFAFSRIEQLARANKINIIPVLQYRYSTPLRNEYASEWRRSPDYYAGWRGKPKLGMGGVLLSHGIHYLDVIAQKTRVSHVKCITGNTPGIYDTALETEARIYLTTPDHDGHINISLTIHPDATNTPAAPYEPFFQAIKDGNPLTLEDARPSLELLTACYKSAITGQRVTLPILPDDEYYQGWTNQLSRKLAAPLQRSA